MAKFKIIEPGRFLSDNEQINITGGGLTCTDSYVHCTQGGSYTSCIQNAVASVGYIVNSECSSVISHLICSEGWQYRNCASGQSFEMCVQRPGGYRE